MITIEEIRKRIKRNDPNQEEKFHKLTELFSEKLTDGKLLLEGLAFYRFGPYFKSLDFSNCLFNNCDFSYLDLRKWRLYEESLKENNIFDGAIFSDSFQTAAAVKKYYVGFFTEEDINDDKGTIAAALRSLEERRNLLIWENFPADIIYYGSPLCQDSEHYLHISKPDYDSGNALGWKLHISVAYHQIKKAFNIAGPIIGQFCPSMKVTDIEQVTSAYAKNRKRNAIGAQITIYLENSNRGRVSPDKVLALITQVTDAFYQHNIHIGSQPLSDAATISPYFSLRHDKSFIPKGYWAPYYEHTWGRWSVYSLTESESDSQYISATEAGRNFNPINAINPYTNILEAPISFSAKTHFELFDCQTAESTAIAVNCTLLAFLQEYTNIYTAMKAEVQKFCSVAFNEAGDLTPWLKPCYQENNENLQNRIKLIVLMDAYFASNQNLTIALLDIIEHEPCDPEFKVLLQAFHQEVAKHEELNDPEERPRMSWNTFKQGIAQLKFHLTEQSIGNPLLVEIEQPAVDNSEAVGMRPRW